MQPELPFQNRRKFSKAQQKVMITMTLDMNLEIAGKIKCVSLLDMVYFINQL